MHTHTHTHSLGFFISNKLFCSFSRGLQFFFYCDNLVSGGQGFTDDMVPLLGDCIQVLHKDGVIVSLGNGPFYV